MGIMLWLATQSVFLISAVFFKFYTIYAFLIFLFRDDYQTYFTVIESLLYFIVSFVLTLIVRFNIKWFVR